MSHSSDPDQQKPPCVTNVAVGDQRKHSGSACMSGHQIRQLKVFSALAEAIHRAYGWVPRSLIEDLTAEVCLAVTLEQAYAEKEWRDLAARAHLPADLVAEVVAELHLPIGGAR
jgi:hypothetical protein